MAVRVVWPPLTQQLDKETVIDASNAPVQEGDDNVEQSSTGIETVDNIENNDQPTEVCSVCVCVSVCVCECVYSHPMIPFKRYTMRKTCTEASLRMFSSFL